MKIESSGSMLMAKALIALVLTCLAVPAMAQEGGYLVQAGDRLEVSVLEDPSLNRTVLVRPDGRMSLPLAGTVAAAGRTPEEIAAAVRNALAADFVTPPNVTVALVAVGAGMEAEAGTIVAIYVMGQVGQPGIYQVPLPVDALQVLALAGGPGVFAARDRIQVRRREASSEIVFLLDYESIEDGATPSQRIDLADGDVIVVPERGLFE